MLSVAKRAATLNMVVRAGKIGWEAGRIFVAGIGEIAAGKDADRGHAQIFDALLFFIVVDYGCCRDASPVVPGQTTAPGRCQWQLSRALPHRA